MLQITFLKGNACGCHGNHIAGFDINLWNF